MNSGDVLIDTKNKSFQVPVMTLPRLPTLPKVSSGLFSTETLEMPQQSEQSACSASVPSFQSSSVAATFTQSFLSEFAADEACFLQIKLLGEPTPVHQKQKKSVSFDFQVGDKNADYDLNYEYNFVRVSSSHGGSTAASATACGGGNSEDHDGWFIN